MAAVTRELPPGTVLDGWRIEAQIAEGGMGMVYAAVQETIGKRAAIKVIRSEMCTNPKACARFLQEARIVNRIRHRNIVDIFHVGQLDDGRPYLVMELLTGATLGDRLAAGRIAALEAVEILLQICAALEAAHAHGVVHRDLKPDNVILTQVGGAVVVKLVDWGIAKMRDPELPAASVGGTLIGTPRYIAPEQARGRSVDSKSDVYSLGAVAYEMFLESPPFTCDNVADLVAAHLCEQATPARDLWPDIPVDLDELLEAMLDKEPEGRPAIAGVAAALLRARDELRRRAGIEGFGEPEPAHANLAVPVGDWSSEPPRRSEQQALLDTSEIRPRTSRRRDGLVIALAGAVSLLLIGAFGQLVSEWRLVGDVTTTRAPGRPASISPSVLAAPVPVVLPVSAPAAANELPAPPRAKPERVRTKPERVRAKPERVRNTRRAEPDRPRGEPNRARHRSHLRPIHPDATIDPFR